MDWHNIGSTNLKYTKYVKLEVNTMEFNISQTINVKESTKIIAGSTENINQVNKFNVYILK